MALFTAGNPLTAAQLNAINGYVRKTADTSMTSNATLTNDPHLFYAIPGAGTFHFELYLLGLSAANAAGDLQVAFSFPTGTAIASGIGPDVSLASGNAVIGQFGVSTAITSGALFNAYGLSTNVTLTHLQVELIATASGTFRLLWAQAASNASASTLKIGSRMLVRQVA